MSHRSPPRRRLVARLVGGAAATALGAVLVVGGAAPAGAQPDRPPVTPTPTSTPGLSVHLDLPGLLQVHVDVPPLTDLLGGAATPSAATRAPVASRPTSVAPTPVARPTHVRTPAVRRAPVVRTTPAPRARPQRPTGAAAGPGRARTGLTPRDTTRTPRASRPRTSTPKAPEQVTDATGSFRRSLSSNAPTWLLLMVVAVCALGTAAVVGLGGRRGRAGS